ncbi:hypothetical protein CSUI_009986, partial [Cystoisospora suis]
LFPRLFCFFFLSCFPLRCFRPVVPFFTRFTSHVLSTLSVLLRFCCLFSLICLFPGPFLALNLSLCVSRPRELFSSAFRFRSSVVLGRRDISRSFFRLPFLIPPFLFPSTICPMDFFEDLFSPPKRPRPASPSDGRRPLGDSIADVSPSASSLAPPPPPRGLRGALCTDRLAIDFREVAFVSFFRPSFHPLVVIPFGLRSSVRYFPCFPFWVAPTTTARSDQVRGRVSLASPSNLACSLFSELPSSSRDRWRSSLCNRPELESQPVEHRPPGWSTLYHMLTGSGHASSSVARPYCIPPGYFRPEPFLALFGGRVHVPPLFDAEISHHSYPSDSSSSAVSDVSTAACSSPSPRRCGFPGSSSAKRSRTAVVSCDSCVVSVSSDSSEESQDLSPSSSSVACAYIHPDTPADVD